MTYLLILAGLVLLFVGGEVLVKGAVALAARLNIPILIIGLTVVALGTSAPEIVVSIQAALNNHPDIALGNIFGSNIANILLVLGISAMLCPLHIHNALIKRDGPALAIITSAFVVFVITGSLLSRLEGFLMIGMLAAYLIYLIKTAGKASDALTPEEIEDLKEQAKEGKKYTIRAVLFVVIGIGMLALGSDLLVQGAVALAEQFGLSEGIIGATLVAVGSSSPEIATCCIAAWRKQPDVVIGNIVGSNLFNLMAGIAPAAILMPLPVAASFLTLDIWAISLATLTLFTLLLRGATFSRITGGLFFIGYVGYITLLFLH